MPKEYFEDLWKEVYLAGTEWDQVADVSRIDWDFEHLDDEVNEGELSDASLYLFGTTEPQLLVTDKAPAGEVLPIPVIVVVKSKLPPPSTVGIKSVQRTEEEILPMEKLKMGWYPVIPDHIKRVNKYKPRVFVLKCEQRRAGLRNMKIDDVKKYEYVLPYVLIPGRDEDEQVDTVVNVMVELPGINKPLVFEYDWELDDLDEFVEEKIKDEELDAEKFKGALKDSIQDQVKATKLRYKEERDSKKRRLDDITPEMKESLLTMKIYKFYPQNEKPNLDACKTKFINRYYGKADEIK